VKDPITGTQEIYEKLGRECSEECLAAMKEYVAKADEQRKKASYSYSLEEFCLTPESVDEAFEEYNKRYLRT